MAVVNKEALTNEEFETIIGRILRVGVIAAATVVLIGGILYLFQPPSSLPNYHVFNPAAPYARSLSGIIENAMVFRSYGIIQVGLLLLIATPVIRVMFSVIAFAVQRDVTYVVVALIVLIVLLYSFIFNGLK